MGRVLVAISLVAIVFLIELNGLLRGRLKAHIDATLGAALILLLVLSLIYFGWRMALLNLVVSLVAGAVLHPLARVVARRLLP